MGPSGSGKTTLLNILASRPTPSSTISSTSTVLINGTKPSKSLFRSLSRFVEQEDALIGSLTVHETLTFASRLSSTSVLPKSERIARIDGLLDSFGLRDQADTLIGTPIRKGLSGGQKRRVGVASQLITAPKILFLDKPTSGLDSAASWEVDNYLRGAAKRNGLIVIASIHQPSTATFDSFDNLLLLSQGKRHFFGGLGEVERYYDGIGYVLPMHVNPAEYLLELVSVDFARDREGAGERLRQLQRAWEESGPAEELREAVEGAETQGDGAELTVEGVERKPGTVSLVWTLLRRGFIKSYRDVVVYGIRVAMYFGESWVRLVGCESKRTNDYRPCGHDGDRMVTPLDRAVIHHTPNKRNRTLAGYPPQSTTCLLTSPKFYGSAFMSFMAVAYVPAFLEDRQTYVKEHENGLYSATELIVSNFLIGVPYLFLISLLFSIISYWLSNFQPTASAFFTWVLWLFLDLLAAESLVVLATSIFPFFVISLAVVAFANGLWMSVDGFMVQPGVLNVFYKYVFHYWDYQKYVFENMMINEFAHRTYECAPATAAEGSCFCMFSSELAGQCQIAGQGVLEQYNYHPGKQGRDVGIMMAIVVGYRLAAWVVLKLRR
jgi:ABC-type multidrug transport system ATPase subunit/ABC-type multidrug transport system permease subunit